MTDKWKLSVRRHFEIFRRFTVNSSPGSSPRQQPSCLGEAWVDIILIPTLSAGIASFMNSKTNNIIATRTDSKNRLDPPHDSDKHCIWLVGFVCASTDFSKKNRFFFVFMIGNGRHQALFVGKLYDGLEIPEKTAGFNQSINQSSLMSYVRHGCPVARARGSCLKRKTKLSMSKTI